MFVEVSGIFLAFNLWKYFNFKSLGMAKRKLSLTRYDTETVKKGEQILYHYYTGGPVRKAKIEEAATDML